jgi:murein DD-endopeptidase MepM/ murein hydrolase activator NlpD
LLADVSGFHDITGSLLEKFTNLNQTARMRSDYFGFEASVKKNDIPLLVSVPAYPPLAGFDPSKLVSGFGTRINPFHKRNYHHDGLDIAAPRGTEVLAAAAGRVTAISFSDLQAGFGNYIEVDHGNGYLTRYANLGEITARYGQKVTKGQPIGLIGISGGSVAPHVHYEILKNGRNVDPVKFLIQGLNASQYEQVWQAAVQQNQSLD